MGESTIAFNSCSYTLNYSKQANTYYSSHHQLLSYDQKTQ